MLSSIHVRGFRSLVDVTLRPGAVTALVGEARSGKSNLLAAMRALADPAAAPPTPADVSAEGDGGIRLEGVLADGRAVSLSGVPPRLVATREGAPPVLYLPAALRSGRVLAGPVAGRAPAGSAARRIRGAVRELGSSRGGSDAASAGALVRGIGSCCEAGERGALVLIEEPELFLRPHTQRYLYRLLRELASSGNQVVYSTHAPAFLNVARIEEFVLLERPVGGGTRVLQPAPLDPGESFRVMSEFDAERSELFLSRAAVLVEGRTEQVVLPFVFRALGHDVDRESISIVECGGKSNIPLFVGVCRAVGVPYVVLHDRDAPAGSRPSAAERALNALIGKVAGRERTVVLEPDFEGVAGLRGNRHKPERAWTRFRSLAADAVPAPLQRAVDIAVSVARD
ncbi:MAG: ATP-dependent nuclease [Actinomycetota bacterium]